MTQALSIVGQNFTPTPLQQAAIDRMEEFAGELKKAGFVMRSGIELEFMVKDKNSRITPVVLDIRAANARLAAMPGLRRFQGIKNEATAEYEIIVGEKVPQGLKTASVAQFSPVQVAATTAAAKRSLRGLLHSNTCLTPFARQERAPYSPMFAAYPHALAGQDHAASDDKTCALHVNASLYDLKGNNAFSADPSLQRQCAQQLVEVQHQAALAFLPKKNSLSRFGDMAHVSVPGGLGTDYVEPQARRRHYSSVNIRGDISELGSDPHDARIENRLPGADADPFVALAVTMAALVQTVRDRQNGLDSLTARKHDLPETRREMVQALGGATAMRKLLGPRLHQALLDNYGKVEIGRA